LLPEGAKPPILSDPTHQSIFQYDSYYRDGLSSGSPTSNFGGGSAHAAGTVGIVKEVGHAHVSGREISSAKRTRMNDV
jgi:hypothetical protein